MVDEDRSKQAGLRGLPPLQTPYLAVAPIPHQQLFPIPKWKPNSGRNRDCHEFQLGVLQLANALGISESQLTEAAPSMETLLAQSSVIVTRSEDKVALAAERRGNQGTSLGRQHKIRRSRMSTSHGPRRRG